MTVEQQVAIWGENSENLRAEEEEVENCHQSVPGAGTTSGGLVQDADHDLLYNKRCKDYMDSAKVEKAWLEL